MQLEAELPESFVSGRALDGVKSPLQDDEVDVFVGGFPCRLIGFTARSVTTLQAFGTANQQGVSLFVVSS